ncbi:MAG: TetR/AcrR family transcriptional regulator, partial [Prevotella sp.]
MRHKEGTDEKILKAAETEFFTKGYDGARTTSIAEKAGVTHAMLHYYFRTKEQLFGEVLSRNIDNMFKVMFS